MISHANTTNTPLSEKMLLADELTLSQNRAYRVPGSDLEKQLAAMLKAMGIKENVDVYVSRSEAINGRMHLNSHGNLRIILTEPLLKALGSTPHGKISEEVKFVLGHELGHLSEGMGKPYRRGGLIPMIALPFAAVAARHIINDMHAKQVPPHEVRQEIYNQDNQEVLSGYAMNELPTRHENKLSDFVKDLAAGMFGFSAGSYVAKINADAIELRCDKWGSKMTSPEAGISFFKKLDAAFEERRQLKIAIPDNDPFKYGEAKTKLEKWLHDFTEATLKSHPNDITRIAKLEKIAAQASRAL